MGNIEQDQDLTKESSASKADNKIVIASFENNGMAADLFDHNPELSGQSASRSPYYIV
jgi:hypothetical protein